MLHNYGELLIAIMILLLSLKFIWMFYHIAKELQAYVVLEEEKHKEAERQREKREKQRAYAHAQTQKRYQGHSKANTSSIKTSSIRSRYTKELEFYKTCKDPFRIIGCTIYASTEQMKKSYRALVKKWHPDRIAALSVSEQELADATTIIQIINIAYEEAARRRMAYTDSI